MQSTDKLLKRISDASSQVGGIVVFLMMLHICIDVLSRNAFGFIIKGTQEIVVNYYMISIVFLPMAAVQRSRGHVFVEIFTSKFSETTRARMDRLVLFWCVLVAAVFFFAASLKAVEMTSEWELAIGSIDLVVWPSRWILAFGMLILAFEFLMPSLRAKPQVTASEMID